ncbi:arylamine N-acetyltransferase family protein [Actomonas aquatica]|uniref:Arylamine N-acetyltransferase n=1 Tax=Actomonas aquatica TaxID=2866162 RepID=A0ABZ1C507_9BACT|nr:arylamine N-acetyltransferase [Opitutus sp. WL0086]WRQ85599.1 arylamine N-acetyltransferase [Opitutus sp. WL0086]
MFDLDAYLRRIGYAGERTPSLAVLRQVLRDHAAAIPFENLATWAGEAVSVELPDIVAKLVTARRGGYCYEHNTLLGAALEALGFTVVPMLARVRWQVPAEIVTGRSHLCLRVTVDGAEWLVDAGFGGIGATAPLRLDTAEVQATSHDRRRLSRRADGTVLQEVELAPGKWADVYIVELTPVFPVDVRVANWFTSTHPDSLFRNALIVTSVQADHRRVLRGREYHERYVDGRVEQRREVADEAALRALLVEAFGLPAEDPGVRAVKLPPVTETPDA